LRGLGLALEASNQIDCQLIRSFPVREYISPITKILRKVIHLRKGNQLATITETAAEIRDGPGGRHHPWPRRALVLLARNKGIVCDLNLGYLF
jgi:ketosteroid isomerase-like protein